MIYGHDNPYEKIKIDKNSYDTQINILNTYEVFTTLEKEELLEVRRFNAPATTAFLAYDIQKVTSGKIQCQFYQYEKDSPECPICQLVPSDEMFDTMREVLLEMWNSASPNLSVDYLKKDEKKI